MTNRLSIIAAQETKSRGPAYGEDPHAGYTAGAAGFICKEGRGAAGSIGKEGAMARRLLRGFVLMGSVAGLGLGCAAGDDGANGEQVGSSSEELSLGGNPASGAILFFSEFPHVQGNGRTCNTCHVAEDGFQLTPAHVEDRWQALQNRKRHNPNADDPLFRSIDADDFDNDFTTLREQGLVRVTIPMAPNVRVLDDPQARSVSVWRSTPTVFSVALTAPYQLEGRVPTLQLQALGALHGHAEIKKEPPAKLLDDVAAFQKLVFPNKHSFEVARAVQEGKPIPPEPSVTGDAVRGKVVFDRECTFCHNGPAFSQSLIPGFFPGNVTDIFVSRPVPPFANPAKFPTSPLPVRVWEITLPDGTKAFRPSTDPGKMLISGDLADLNAFEFSQLRGISKTAPYFHDNSAKTLQDVGRHYQEFFFALSSLGNPGLTPFLNDDEIEPLAAYLNTL
jgi:cytochrome c peroxidase